MELIYADANLVPLGILKDFAMEHEISTKTEKNTFEIKIGKYSEDITWVYSNGTEYGGRINKICPDTSSDITKYSGTTWLGLLETKIIVPVEDYVILTGTFHEIIEIVITMCGLSKCFTVSKKDTPYITHRFNRYVDALSGIRGMLAQYDYKMSLVVNNGICELEAVPISYINDTREISSDLFDFKITKQRYSCNHLIALGSGKLSDRMVIHKYVQKDGSIGDEQYYFDLDEVVETLDYPNVESEEELEKKAVEELKKKSSEDGIKITAYDLNADVGDQITACNVKYGIKATQYVVNKIVTINDNCIKNQYKVGNTL